MLAVASPVKQALHNGYVDQEEPTLHSHSECIGPVETVLTCTGKGTSFLTLQCKNYHACSTWSDGISHKLGPLFSMKKLVWKRKAIQPLRSEGKPSVP